MEMKSDEREEVAKAIWDGAKAGVKLIEIRGVKADAECSMSGFSSRFLRDFKEKSKLKNKIGSEQSDFEQILFKELKTYSLHDKKMMLMVARLMLRAMSRSSYRKLGYYDELTREERNKVSSKLYDEAGFSVKMGTNTNVDVTKQSLRSKGLPDHSSVMENEPLWECKPTEKEELRARSECQRKGSCRDPEYCNSSQYCVNGDIVRSEKPLRKYLQGYMPNFYELNFCDSELEEYEPSWKSVCKVSRIPHSEYNPASHQYSFNVNWTCSDEHLLDEFKKWLYMRRPERFKKEGRMNKNKKIWLRMRDFRFWHVDYVHLKAAEKMEVYKRLYTPLNSQAVELSDTQLRNSANEGLKFIEMAVLCCRYLTSHGYVDEASLY